MSKRIHKTTSHAPTEFSLMAVGAHADDIELQAGGTLAKYREAGYEIVYVMATNNMSGGEWALRDEESDRPLHIRTMELRKSEADAGARFFGGTAIHLDHPQRHYMRSDGKRIKSDFGTLRPDGLVHGMPGILWAHEHEPSVDRVTELILQHNPEAILTHGGQIANLEHLATSLLVAKAYWKALEQGYHGMMLHWHDLGVHILGEAHKNHWDTHVNISAYWDEKLRSVLCHKTMKPDPAALDWPQWGPACGCLHAEVFDIAARATTALQQGAFTMEILRNQQGRRPAFPQMDVLEMEENLPESGVIQ